MLDDGIARFARRLRAAVMALMVMIVGLHVVARTGGWLGPLRVVSMDRAESGTSFALLSDLTTVLFAAALWRLAQMLRAIDGRTPFSALVTARFRGFALLLLLWASASAVGSALVGMALHRFGWRQPVLLRLDMRDVWMVCVAGLLFLIARLFDRARAIEVDLSEIV